MMRERGLDVDHSTVFRWVQRYGPEINKRIRPHRKMSGTSYRGDETYIKVGKTCKHRYRAVDKEGQTIHLRRSVKGFLALTPGSRRRISAARIPSVQALQVLDLVVGLARLPAPVHDSDPLGGQRPHRHLVRLPLRTLPHVERPRPERVPNRFPGVFDEALPQELRTAEPPVHPRALPTPLDYRRHPRQTGHPLGRSEAGAGGAEGNQRVFSSSGSHALSLSRGRAGRQTSCLASDQSMPTRAAYSSIVPPVEKNSGDRDMPAEARRSHYS